MKEATFTNCIDIMEKSLGWNELSEEKKMQVAALLSDRVMEMAGYRRKHA